MDVLVNVDEIAAALSTAEEKASGAGAHFDQAATALEECCQALGQAVQGTGDQALGQALAALAELSVEPLRGLVTRAITTAANYRESLVGQPPPAARPAPSGSTAPANKALEEPDEVKAARAQLPPPVVKGTRTRTHGQWSSTDAPADRKPITSGTRDDLYEPTQRYLQEHGMGQTVIGSHVETKVAVHMRQEDIQDVTVVINHQPCEGPLGCDTLLPRVLPEGSTLTVYGTAQDGTHTKHTYTGRQDT